MFLPTLVTSGPDISFIRCQYREIDRLLSDVTEGIRQLDRKGKLLCHDDPEEQRIGFYLSSAEGGQRWWFCISMEDFRHGLHYVDPEFGKKYTHILGLFRFTTGRLKLTSLLESGMSVHDIEHLLRSPIYRFLQQTAGFWEDRNPESPESILLKRLIKGLESGDHL